MSDRKTISVCFIGLNAYPLFNPAVKATFGGAEVDLYLLAIELAKDNNFGVSFVVGDFGQPDSERIESVNVHKSLNVKKNFFLHSPKIWNALKKANADIYVSEACSLGTTLNAFFCKRHGKKFVYRTAHTRETEGGYFKQHKIRAPFVQWAFRSADLLITQNDQDRGALLSTQKLPSVVIRNACKVSESVSPKNDTVLWVGRSLPVKRPDLFLRLANSMPDKKFVMICSKGSSDHNYDTLVDNSKNIRNLTFLKYVSFHEIDRYFEQARVFVSTSDSEGFPNTFVQACKSRTPILSLHVNPDKFLDKHQCGFCADGKWELFVNTLNDWFSSSQPEVLGQNGLKYIKENHDMNTIIQQYKDMFCHLADITEKT